ncbi:hypothetical protein Q7P35_006912 [Cladosporium inversicolor]
MATKKTPGKSILKQPSKPTPEAATSQAAAADEEAAKAEADAAAQKKRHFDIAIKHALLIDHQRKTQDQVLNHIELLLDFPRSSQPTTQDAVQFLQLVSIFQPSNFDELVEERRIDRKCGYVLCANEPRGLHLKDSETWKLKKGAVDWCSNDCMRKGFYIKAQLGEVPAWERVPGQQPPVVLHEDDRHLTPAPNVEADQAKSQHIKQRVAERSELAMERGEQATSLRPDQVMVDFIVEKTPTARQPPAETKVKFASSTAIEGYEPKGMVSNTVDVNPAAEVAAMLNIPSAKAPVKDEEDSSDKSEADDDEDQQWKDMFDQMRKRD